jgi:hypothetical protein
VVARARQVLAELEARAAATGGASLVPPVRGELVEPWASASISSPVRPELVEGGQPLSTAVSASPPDPLPDPVRKCLAAVEPDRLSPRQALEIIYTLKALITP